ncbi:MAG: TIGR01777 family oxidoreductase, partial [Phycisphaeraceae bacterium]|nr:TIGR01777 family oxidoreductase [Phycisphaeraceae bacterium]
RHRVTAADLAAQQRGESRPRMHVWITGASGLVGARLATFLTTAGHTVSAVSRSESGEVCWHPATGEVRFDPMRKPDVVVHLAGENLAGGRWTARRRAAIESSRVGATRKLCETLAKMRRESGAPTTLLCASAVGFYGSRGDEVLTENSPGGEGFLADVCRGWEEATRPAADAGVRVVNLRLGIVLWPTGGALGKMLPAFRAGLGGVVGSGRQYWSWISLDDAVYAMHEAMVQPGLIGPANLVAPQAITSRQFVKTLGRVLRRPTLLPAPAGLLKLAMGEMAEQTLLASQRVEPTRLLAAGMHFASPGLEGALRHLLGRQRVSTGSNRGRRPSAHSPAFSRTKPST